MTLMEFYKDMQGRLQAADIVSSDLEARWILQERAGVEWGDILAAPDTILPMEKIKEMNQDVGRRLEGIPLSRLYGRREFWGMEFDLGDETLDPRPDTEILVEVALSHFKGDQPQIFADLGTGTGCIAVALLKAWPDSICVAVDLSKEALCVAQSNARKHGVANRFLPICGNWMDALQVDFDLIASNPPYIPNRDIQNLAKNVQNFDPILALDGGKDGLQAYRDIFLQAKSRLKSCGRILFEVGYDQSESVMRLSEDSGFFVEGVHRDLSGWPRVVDIISGDK